MNANTLPYNTISFLKEFAFSPLVSGSVLAAANYAPNATRQVLEALASSFPWLHISPHILQSPWLKRSLGALLAVGLYRQLTALADSLALNSWRLTAASGWHWDNEIAVVTGGSGGIGKYIIERLTANGVRVAVLDVQVLPKELENNPRVKFYHCDLTSEESVATAANSVRQELGHPSIVINNAGVSRPTPILKTLPTSLRASFGVNSISLWLTAQEFLPHMIMENKGHIVTVASLASFFTMASSADYCASKAAALCFHEALKVEIPHLYKAPNILASIVHPYFVQTPMTDPIGSKLDRLGVKMLHPDQVAQPIVAQILRRKGGRIIVPKNASMVSGFRGWPLWVQDSIRSAFGKSAAGTM